MTNGRTLGNCALGLPGIFVSDSLIPVDAATAITRPYYRSKREDFDNAAVPRDRRHTNSFADVGPERD